MGAVQDIVTTHPHIVEKATAAGAYGGSAAAVGASTTMFLGFPVNEWITLIVGLGGLIIAVMSYRLNARYKRLHYELALRQAGEIDQ